ncbi:ExbD/TolR family protein [Aestuariivita boseongensis]|uniref:ExbD/TolR family protein n=1 Tax=Aestuariivita boseongensis TaxID=1470562 RepID=UPI0006835D31|nr:biopolymer transporter ExbD [Aestuariivita boseongensis]
MRRARTRSQREPTIALINIVFLMLIFFMVAGTLAPPLEADVRLVETADLEGIAPPDALILSADGTIFYRGEVLRDAGAFVERLPSEDATVRLVPDRALPAERLVAIAAHLRAAGADRVMIVTERGLK